MTTFAGPLAPGVVDVIKELLREDLAYSGQSRHTLPLGTRAGVPSVARGASVQQILGTLAPEIARQAGEPQGILFRPHERPQMIPRPFVRTDVSYRDLGDEELQIWFTTVGSEATCF